MAKEKCEKVAICGTCNQSGCCSQQEKEAHAEKRLGLELSHIKHRPGSCTIPEWIQRWALGC